MVLLHELVEAVLGSGPGSSLESKNWISMDGGGILMNFAGYIYIYMYIACVYIYMYILHVCIYIYYVYIYIYIEYIYYIVPFIRLEPRL